jgi:hypothetical protein
MGMENSRSRSEYVHLLLLYLAQRARLCMFMRLCAHHQGCSLLGTRAVAHDGDTLTNGVQ